MHIMCSRAVVGRGLSFIELLVTLAVATIVLAVGVPSFADMRREYRLSVFSNDLHAAMLLARSEAIRRGHRVTLCSSQDALQCSAGVGWEAGWIVFADPNANARVDSGEALILVRNAAFPGVVAPGNATLARYLSYVPSGSSRSITGALQMGTIRVCNGKHERALVVSATGRVRVERRPACT